jgi:hypothetical protein
LAGDLTWHVYSDDAQSGLLAVVDEDEIESPEPHYPFLMSCAADQEWTMFVSDIDAKRLGETIAEGDQPTFSLSATTSGKTAASGDFFPEISFSQMETVWEYSSIWDLGVLDHLLEADRVAIKGTGIDLNLPTKAMKAALAEFKAFCDKLGAPDATEPAPDNGAP